MLKDTLKMIIPKSVNVHEVIIEVFLPQLSVTKGIKTYPNIAPA